MNRRAKWIALAAAALIWFLLVGWGRRQTVSAYIEMSGEGESLAFSVSLSSESSSTVICSFRDESGDLWLFLPSWSEGRILQTQSESPLASWNGETLTAGLTAELSDGHTLTLLTGSAIPTVSLTLEHEFSYVQSDQEASDSGSIEIVDADGTLLHSGKLGRISGRGNSSWNEEKKPFNITLGEPAALLEDGVVTDSYCLLSSTDQTFLRNRISREMAQEAGAASLNAVIVNLYVNGSYEGVYELSERVTAQNLGIYDLEEETERLNAAQEAPVQQTTGESADDWNASVTGKWWVYAQEPEDFTGGYLLEADDAIRYESEASGFILESGAYLVVKSPEYLSAVQYRYLSTYLQNCEDLIAASAGLEGSEALETCLDVSGFVGKYLVEEVSKNIDSSSTSQYLYKDRDGLLCAGPVWDYDWAYGADREQEGIDYSDPEGFAANQVTGSFTWWQLLYENGAFYDQVTEVYEESVYPWLQELTEELLAAWEEELTDSAVMDYLRWGKVSSDVPEDVAVWYHSEVEEVRSFLEERMEFLYREWCGE